VLQALFGLSIVHRAGLTHERNVHAIAVRAAEGIADDVAREVFDPYSYDLSLLLFCLRCLNEQGQEAEALTQFAREVASVLQRLDSVPARLALEAQLLTSLGYAVPPVDPGGSTCIPDPPTALLTSDVEQIRSTCNWALGASFGGGKFVTAPGHGELVEVLGALLLHKLREYDLILGSALLRTVCYLAAADRAECRHAVGYLLAQQQTDGAFGYFARETQDSGAVVDPVIELHLPITVSVTWAICQHAIPGFSLAL
jgi:hypothetical protein